MKPLRRLRRRSLIRVISFITAAFFVTIGIAVSGYVMAYNYRTVIENNYTDALNQLSFYVGNMDATLTKSMYAGTDEQFLLLSAKLATEAAQAKNNLSKLPQSGVKLDNTYRFLSQAGEYAMSLTKRISQGERISQDEWNNLLALRTYADKMAAEIATMQELAQDHNFVIGQVQAAVNDTKSMSNSSDQTASGTSSGNEGEEKKAKNISDGFNEIETGFTGYPSLIYDGPFSDHIMNAHPKLIADKSEISPEEAQNKAAKTVGQDPSALTRGDDENSVMPSYTFYSDTFHVAVTKNDGYPVYMFDNRAVGQPSLQQEDAIKRAKSYLESIGYTNMAPTYSGTSGGICTINFAYDLDGILVYTDLIKVSVALDNGGVVGFDARGYIMNHYDRKTPKASITREEGLESVSPLLKIENSRLAIIPSEGSNQVFCYEYTCTGKEGERVLAYVNATTGHAEQLLIIIDTGEGDMTI